MRKGPGPAGRAARSAALAGLTAWVLLAGLLLAPPARAAEQLAEAADALAAGPGVWAAEDYEDIDEQALALMRARYAEARTPVRVALLTEEIPEGDAAAEELAARVGEPGVYLVFNEVHTPVSDSPSRAYAWAVADVPVSTEQLSEEMYARVGIPSGHFLLSLPDALDNDLRPAVAATAGAEPFFVDPAVTAAFPELDAALLRDSFAGVPNVRAALVSGLGGDLAEAQAPMLTGLPDDGVAVLIQWEDDGSFAAVFGAGPDVPFDISDLETVIGASAITDLPVREVPQRLALLAALLSPTEVTETARDALAEAPVYVHPGISDWRTGPEELAALGEELAAADPAAGVAFLPHPVLELRAGGTLPSEESALAELVAPDGRNVAVFTVDPYHGGHVRDTSATGDAAFVEAAGWAHGSEAFLGETLTDLLGEMDRLGIAEPAAGGAEPATGGTDDAGLRTAAQILLLAVAALLLPLLARNLTPHGRRARRVRAAARRRGLLAALPAERAAVLLAEAERAARATDEQLIRLGDDLARVPRPAGAAGVRRLQRLRSDYEWVLDVRAHLASREEVGGIRKDIARLRRALGRLPPPTGTSGD
ncbi:hypothetical protein [Streptomyces marincola]|uniref:hypothetical protein n=1 Tax=Streptomyces marincola TaxID=2878388 RepID=UPI001CF0E4F5|nr:hypothetical protein [Streptomyces marincola]UCM90092.1 hypothetical protein LC193_20270 [Streptomyces marincola]